MNDKYAGLNSFEIGAKLTRELAREYPIPPQALPHDDVERLNLRHCVTTDKFWRMFAGSSSDLLTYRAGIVELEIRTTRKVLEAEGKPKWTIRNQIKAWGQERLLSKAHGFVAHIMLRDKALGYSCDADKVDSSNIDFVIGEMCAPDPDLKVAEWLGSFDDLA